MDKELIIVINRLGEYKGAHDLFRHEHLNVKLQATHRFGWFTDYIFPTVNILNHLVDKADATIYDNNDH